MRILIALILCFAAVASPAMAQSSPTDEEINNAWQICAPHEIVNDTWRPGFENCAKVKAAHLNLQSSFHAKTTADKASVDNLAKRLK